MKARLVTSVIVNVVGLFTPLAAIYLIYGGEQRVQGDGPGVAGQLAVLAASSMFSFICGLLSSWILKKNTLTPIEVLRDAVKDERATAS